MRFVAPITLFLVCLSYGQVPDVNVKVDARLGYTNAVDKNSSNLRTYDLFGRRSTFGLQLTLEPGLRAFVSQRFEQIKGDGDRDQLDQFYVEDIGAWVVGKQLLPFGSTDIINERALAIRTDTFSLRSVPVVACACDSGAGKPRGIVVKIGGSRLNFSAAVGDNFGISASTLTYLRAPEDSPGVGRGYKEIVGGELRARLQNVEAKIEAITMRRPNLATDSQYEIFDSSISFIPDKYRQLTFGLTRDLTHSQTALRIVGSFYVINGIRLEGILQYKDGKYSALGIYARLKL